jgi:hypothetical protein
MDSQASPVAAERRPIGAGLLLPIDSVRRTEAAVYQASLPTKRAVSETAPLLLLPPHFPKREPALSRGSSAKAEARSSASLRRGLLIA